MNTNVPDNLPTEENIPILENPVAPVMISPEEIPEAPQKSSVPISILESDTTLKTSMDEKYKKAMEYGQKGILGILILIFLVIGIYGIITVVPYIVSSTGLSSLFSPKEALTINVRTDPIISGQQFTFSITHRGATQYGSYTWGYSCGGASLKKRTLTSDDTIACDKNIDIAVGDELSLITPATKTNSGIHFYTTFIGLDGRKTTAEKNVGVNGTDGVQNTSVTPTETKAPATVSKPTTTKGVVSHAIGGGLPDLKVTVIKTGIELPGTQAVVATQNIGPNDRAGITFSIANVGGMATGPWQFKAIVPNQYPAQIYHSPIQSSLAPGDRIEFTLGFDGTNGSTIGSILIQADDVDAIKELSEDNNSGTATFTRSGANTTYNNIYTGSYPSYSYPYQAVYNQNTQYYSASGETDLAIQTVTPGFIASNGVFNSATTIAGYYTAAVQVEVENRGGTQTGNFDIDVVIPTSNDTYNNSYYSNSNNYIYSNSSGYNTIHTGNQYSLSSGERRIITIELPNIRRQNSNDIRIILDPNNRIQEKDETNNELRTTIRVN